MSSKKSKKYIKQNLRNEPSTIPVILALILGSFAYLQNKYGQFSDIRGFYGLHFSDGLHHWPFSYHTLSGSDSESHPVEYPVLTGLTMWLISFLIMPSETAVIDYFKITVTLNLFLFVLTVVIIKKLSKNYWAIIFLVCPAVLYSLNRNWDIWAVFTMVLSIFLFEKNQTKLSAVLLAVSIAFKFFPVVLLLPIFVIYHRNQNLKGFYKYFRNTFLVWIIINLPFIFINFRGWAYFYEFSFSRSLGSASIFEIMNIFGLNLISNETIFYILNIIIFSIVSFFLYFTKSSLTLAESSFFVMFAFILFNKQYSMQYIIWLSALAVISISKLNKKYHFLILALFISWQISDFLFQISFFQKVLRSTSSSPQNLNGFVFTDNIYGAIGIVRYVFAISFFVALMAVYLAQKREITELNSRRHN
ncbi:MAG: hypothetical protein WCJ43_05205 [Actinomycetes bacterium]